MTIEKAHPVPSGSLPEETETSKRPLREYTKTRKRSLARRGVLWLGQTCNLRCYFCYFLNRISDNKHPEHDFMTLDKAKEICRTLREYYGNTAIDIQGGEPTIYPGILDLIAYCREIGLHPTLIIFALLIGGSLWGFIGLLIAVPLAAIIKVFLIAALEWLKKIMPAHM